MKNTPIDRSLVDQMIAQNSIKEVGKASIREIKRLINDIENASGTKFVRMEMGIPGIPACKIGVEAQIEALNNGIATIYPDLDGTPDLKKEASRFIKNFIDLDISPESCFPTVGSMMAGLTQTLRNLKELHVLDDIEFFELKKFALAAQKVRQILLDANYQQENLYDLSKVIDTLDPEGSRIAHFYVYSCYQPELEDLRKQMNQTVDDTEREKLLWEAEQLEDSVRQRLTEQLQPYTDSLLYNLQHIGALDVLNAKAQMAVAWQLTKPEGVEAASVLAAHDCEVMLFEKSAAPLSNVLDKAFLFPDFSSAQDLAKQLEAKLLPDNIKVHCQKEIVDVKKVDDEFKIYDSEGKVYIADNVLITTGYTIFDAHRKEELGYGIYKGVINSLDLERMILHHQITNSKIVVEMAI